MNMRDASARARRLYQAFALACAVVLPWVPIQSAHAQVADDGFIGQIKSMYRTEAQSSAGMKAREALNDQAQSDANCEHLKGARDAAAKLYMKNKVPPDPSQIIQASTCFLDVMDIRIPTTGFGALDFLIKGLAKYLGVCEKQRPFWENIERQMNEGQYKAILYSNSLTPWGGGGATYSPYEQSMKGAQPVQPTQPDQVSSAGVVSGAVNMLVGAKNQQISDLAAQITDLQKRLGLYQGGTDTSWISGGGP